MLQLTGVVAGYGGGAVLQGVDLLCDGGTITCVVGPNGAGKSTVLRVVSGLLTPSEGTVMMGDTKLSGQSAAAILRAGVTQVPQSQALFPHMSVRENVLMGGFLIRRNKKLLASRLEQVEQLVPLVADRATQHGGNLSGGQRRMVEIAPRRHWPGSRPCWPGCAGPSRPPPCSGPVRYASRPGRRAPGGCFSPATPPATWTP